MQTLLIISVVMGILLIIGNLYLETKIRAQKGNVYFPYYKRNSLLTRAERSFFSVLQGIKNDEFEVFTKVRVADIVGIEKGLTKSERAKAFNRIRSKHFDFVICDKKRVSVICIIELDDSSHLKPQAKRNDDFKNKLCASCSLPLIRIKAARSYNATEIRNQILNSQKTTV